jgi:hypothetical protein
MFINLETLHLLMFLRARGIGSRIIATINRFNTMEKEVDQPAAIIYGPQMMMRNRHLCRGSLEKDEATFLVLDTKA